MKTLSKKILSKVLEKLGYEPKRHQTFQIAPHQYIKLCGSKKPDIYIGEHTVINGLSIYCWDEKISIKIGKYCSIADEVMIVAGGEHDTDWVTTYPLIDHWKLEHLYSKRKPRWKGPIEIGHDVWIGNRATILSGVSIGDGVVIGAGAMVVKDVPAYAIVAGNPARLIRYRFTEEQINSLLSIKWWDWPKELIEERAADFTNLELFLEKYSSTQR